MEEYAQPIDCENKFWPTTFAKYIPLPIPMDNLSSLEWHDWMPHAIDKANNPKIPRIDKYHIFQYQMNLARYRMHDCHYARVLCAVLTSSDMYSPPPLSFHFWYFLTHLHKLSGRRHGTHLSLIKFPMVEWYRLILDLRGPVSFKSNIDTTCVRLLIRKPFDGWIARLVMVIVTVMIMVMVMVEVKENNQNRSDQLSRPLFHGIYDGARNRNRFGFRFGFWFGIGMGSVIASSGFRLSAFGYTWIYLHNLQMFMALRPFRFPNKSRLCKYLIGMSATVFLR